MLHVHLNEVTGVATLEPDGALSESDFKLAAKIIDPYIEKCGALSGIIIHVESFPGWNSFSSLITHLQFVKGHHKKVSRVAFATDSPIKSVAENIACHFVSAEIKTFTFNELDAAKEWVQGGDA